VVLGRYVLNRSADGEYIAEYIRRDGGVMGYFIIPKKYKMDPKERAAKYEYYLKSGRVIPPELRPKASDELLERAKLRNEVMRLRAERNAAKEADETQPKGKPSDRAKSREAPPRETYTKPDTPPHTNTSWKSWFNWT
jgi:hypothetical protein